MTIMRRFVPQRDLRHTGFTASLRRLVAEVPGLHAATFCDAEGEIIDYFSYFDPYETKVIAAVLGLLLDTTARVGPRLAGGHLREMIVQTDEYVLLARRIAGDCVLAAVLARDGALAKLLAGFDDAEARILTEAGM